MNPLYGDIDPYWMALAGIDEAIRNLICVGGRVDRIALLDNFCWARCTDPEVLGSLVRAAQACYDGAMAFQAPFISGKDSLNNEFVCEDGTVIRIPPTLLISAMSIVDDIDQCVTMDLKKPGNLLFVVGRTNNELGGSHYYKGHGHTGANVPRLDLTLAPRIARQIAVGHRRRTGRELPRLLRGRPGGGAGGDGVCRRSGHRGRPAGTAQEQGLLADRCAVVQRVQQPVRRRSDAEEFRCLREDEC